MRMVVKDSRKSIWISAGIYLSMLIYYLLLFRIILNSGMSADDMWNSNLWASKYTGEIGAWEIAYSQFFVWLRLGRFFPVSNLAPFVFQFCQTIVLYKLAIVLAVYLDNLICSLCVREMTHSALYGYFYMLLFPVFIQLTPEYDSGLYCYHLLIQTVVLFGFLSIYGLIRYIDTDKKRYNVLSAITLLLAMCTYEVGFVYIFVLIYVAAVRTGSFKKTIRYGLADGIVFVLIGLCNVAVRVFWKEGTYDGIHVEFSPGRILITLLKQCSTCLPLGRYICTWLKGAPPYSEVYTYSVTDIIRQIRWLDIVTISLFLVCYICMVRHLRVQKKHIEHTTIWYMLATGMIIWIVPGFLIALSGKYQQLLGWCSGHLPAYMQSLGFTLIILGMVLMVWNGLKGEKKRILFAGVCGMIAVFIILLNQVTGRQALEFMNGFRKYPQENIASASEAGIFDEFDGQANKVLIGMTSYIYDTSSSRQFYSKFTRKNIYAASRQDFLASISEESADVPYTVMREANLLSYDLTELNQDYYGIFNMADQTSGALILGELVTLDYSMEDSQIRHIWIRDPVVYVCGNGEAMAGVDISHWVLEEEKNDCRIYRLSGQYDIYQNPDYYSTEYRTGVLYQE